jgi:hypothetical protein
MHSSLYRPIQPPIEIYKEIDSSPTKHQEISTRGVIFYSDDPIEIGTTVNISLKLISMTGSIDFSTKVFKCNQVKGQEYYEIYGNFYGLSHEKEKEVFEFIGKE